MKLIAFSLKHPVTVTVAALLLSLFGMLALFQLPVQLTPDVDRPVVTVSTLWPGAGPQEVEREIVDKQEQFLKNVQGLVQMTSESSQGQGTVTLEFGVGDDIDAALLRVSQALDRVPAYPENAEKPTVAGSGGDDGSAIAWFAVQTIPGNERDIATYYTFMEEEVKPRFERVKGVARSNVRGGREQELQIVVDPARMAAHGVTYGELARALREENVNRSGGTLDEGKRQYALRTTGEYQSPEDAAGVVVAMRGGVPVLVKDLAEVRLDYKKPAVSVWHFGNRSITMNAIRETGANVLETMDGLQAAMDEMNEGILKARGLRMRQVYDETVYVRGAIGLVKQNLFVGGLLAIAVLFLFLRSASSTGVIATAIPLSIVGTFLAMQAFGRSVNVISLAGMAFAVGMVVDNSIVVLENIYRHMEMGKDRFQAALDGASEVWGAVLASTLTTVAVFLPVLFIQEEAGQLFRDIALAISASVSLSLVISLTMVPSLAARVLTTASAEKLHHVAKLDFLHRFMDACSRLGGRFRDGVMALLDRVLAEKRFRWSVVAGMTLASLLLSWLLAPAAEYMPAGNRNMVFGRMLPPPGYNLAEIETIGKDFSEALRPHFQPPGGPPAQKQPAVENLFFVSFGRSAFLGAVSADPSRVRELIPVFREPLAKVPGLITMVSQASLFRRIGGQGIDIQITGPNLERLLELGREIFGRVRQVLPTAQARPVPGLELGNPEIRVTPDRDRMAELGLGTGDIGFAVDAAADGVKVAEYRWFGLNLDMTVMGPRPGEGGMRHGQEIENLLIPTSSGRVVDLGSVARVELTTGPDQIQRYERQRAITIQVQPHETMPLAQAMDIIRGQIIEPMEKEGRLADFERLTLTGAADALSKALKSFQWNFLLAILITYLLMSALFENFLHPFVIMFSVPLGAVGGFMGLRLVHAFVPTQQMDLLTMLGFVILVGTVVNNAILVVEQGLIHMRRDGMEPREALRESVRVRIRPIFMSVSTSVFGMLPLILFPGAGSEIYRGLGSVVVGGLILSTVFTLILIPALFMLVLEAQEKLPAWAAERLATLRRKPQISR